MKKIHTNWKAANARLIKACILACLFLTIPTSYAQTSEKKITLTCDKVPFEKALQRLAQQAGVFFAYSLNFADANRLVSFSVKNEPMNTALIRICGQMGFEYKQQGKHFILRKKVVLPKTPVKKANVVAKASPKIAQPTVPSVKKDSTPVVAAAPVKETARDPQMDSVAIAMDSLLASVDTATAQADTDTLLVFDLDKSAPKVDTLADSVLVFLFKKSARSRKIVTPSRTYTYHPHPLPRIRTGADLERFLFGRRNDSEADTTQSDTLQPEANNNRQASAANRYQTRRASGRSSRTYSQWPNGSGFMVRPGIYFNEVTYLGAELQLGTPLVFGIVNLGLTNNSITRIGYGAGFSLPVAPRWSVGAEFTTAKVRRSFEYEQPDPAPEFDVQLSSWHHRIQMVARWQVSARFQLALSPTFNWLNTRYTIDNGPLPFAIDRPFPVPYKAYQKLFYFAATSRTIAPAYAGYGRNNDQQPFYIPSDEYLDFRTQAYFRNTKMWIGGQVGIYYTFGVSSRR